MYKFNSIFVATTVSIALAGCVAGGGSPSYVGSGPLNLSKSVKANFYWYKTELAVPMYFAVSIDGKHEGHGYCNSSPGCMPYSDPYYVINTCESKSNGVPCKIYADGKNVVWNTDAKKAP